MLFATETPVPGFPRVTCYEDSWTMHVIRSHPELAFKERDVEAALRDPDFVLDGAPTRNVMFLSTRHVNPFDAPLLVVVSVRAAALVTAFYKDRWANFIPTMLTTGAILWAR